MDTAKNLFDKKHSTLWRISMWANGLAPVAVLVFTLMMINQTIRYNSYVQDQYQTNLINLFATNPFVTVELLTLILRWIVQGAFYFLVLKGVGLALDMIVETDLNYRYRNTDEEGINE